MIATSIRGAVVARPYTPTMKSVWDNAVEQSRNGTFLLLRDYMEYHAHRFTDVSLLIQDDQDRVLALFPANRDGERIVSHGGLTYGGLILPEETGTTKVLEILRAIGSHYRQVGVTHIDYKTIPAIYHRLPTEEDRWGLFKLGARLIRRDLLTVVPGNRSVRRLGSQRKRGLKRALKAGITVREAGADPAHWSAYWTLLGKVLAQCHEVAPVHTLEEILLLRARFPRHIRLFSCWHEGTLVAGTVIYQDSRVAHVQYIASGKAGRRMGALDLLFHNLLEEVFSNHPWFDFGISNEGDGWILNRGLINWKEGFGAHAVVHDHYRLSLETDFTDTET